MLYQLPHRELKFLIKYQESRMSEVSYGDRKPRSEGRNKNSVKFPINTQRSQVYSVMWLFHFDIISCKFSNLHSERLLNVSSEIKY